MHGAIIKTKALCSFKTLQTLNSVTQLNMPEDQNRLHPPHNGQMLRQLQEKYETERVSPTATFFTKI
jgi:hypothetical protein